MTTGMGRPENNERSGEPLHVHLGMTDQRNSLLGGLGSDESLALRGAVKKLGRRNDSYLVTGARPPI